MQTLSLVFWLFAAVAVGGVTLASASTLGLKLPKALGMVHGMAALASVALLLIVNFLGGQDTPETAWWALAVFTVGLIGGLLFFRVLFPQRTPTLLIVGHGGLGVLGLYLLYCAAQPF
ncbi:hypothetical protein [Sinimarinibacterium sp. NLF-5-8]|uniref:hypothetical protein n=1 Tax=Sinimarinibacterium sp. NLF-5-8 TaxID=2698684 RepID=UPI00137BEA5A|nr:hypothetical protein [Sinimarinibacterium sp. NLF-5-8]QHS11257.1 hypothetical protein GT972_14610 [Sinimarinibacterium sp. NLF-5-8]